LGLSLTRWSVRTLSAQIIKDGILTSIHYSSVCLMLRAVDLQPHRTLYWKRGCDPDFTKKAVHVLWYYEQAQRLNAAQEPVFCCDEKPGIQLLGRPHPDMPMRPGCPVRREFEYVRLGVGLLFMIFNVITGKFFCRAPQGKNSAQFTALLDEHLETLPDAKRVHYIMDNGSTHVSAHTQEWLKAKRGRVCFHYTPKYASWLNQAEIALNNFSTYYLRGRVWRSPDEFAPHVQASETEYNRDRAHPFDWSFTRNRFREWQNRCSTSSTGH
jgi:transposase